MSKPKLWIPFDVLTYEQLERLGIAGRMQSSVSDCFPFSLEGAKKIGLSPEQMKSARKQKADGYKS